MRRREFIAGAAAGSAALLAGCASLGLGASRARQRLFFTSAGKTCLLNADGSGFKVLEFDAPGQATWQPCGFFPDGRVLLLSMEPRRDGPGRPFEKYYHQTPTHIWIHDLDSGSMEEIATKNRIAPFQTPALLLGGGRMLVQVVRDDGGNLFSMNLDGSDAREFTRVGEGLPYGLSLSPDGSRVAFHLAGPQGYQIWTSDAEGQDRKLVAAGGDSLFFGPTWSPDGEWLAFQNCRYKQDPGHDWSDLCVARPDGGDFRALTQGQTLWFGASYGSPETRGGGSNIPTWTRHGKILFSHRLPDSKVAWEFQPQRPDVDHFNRDYRPDLARGGAEVRSFDPNDGSVVRLTRSDPPVWDFRASESPDGKLVAFCRCAVGEAPALWVMNSDGSLPRMIARGLDGKGADHPRWIPSAPRSTELTPPRGRT